MSNPFHFLGGPSPGREWQCTIFDGVIGLTHVKLASSIKKNINQFKLNKVFLSEQKAAPGIQHHSSSHRNFYVFSSSQSENQVSLPLLCTIGARTILLFKARIPSVVWIS
jgi:hypothetical protein